MKIGLRQSSGADFQSVMIKIFLFLIIMSLFLLSASDYEEGVAVRTELVVHLKGGLVCLHYVFVSSECSH